MAGILPRSFFAGRDTAGVARSLVGCRLCRRFADGRVVRLALTEVEAYDGPEDKACHAHRGKTARTAVMFGPPGHFYVYLCYGMHWMLNIVTGPPDYPAAVLIRGAGDVSGPGRLTRHLAVDKAINAMPLGRATGLWVEGPAAARADGVIRATPRIGVHYAGPVWRDKPLRFVTNPY